MDLKTWNERFERMLELQREDAGIEEQLARAERTVSGARAKVDRARTEQLVENTPAATKAVQAAEGELAAAVEVRDELATRAGHLERAGEMLRKDLERAAYDLKHANEKSLREDVAAKLAEVRPSVIEALELAVMDRALTGHGPADGPGDALDAALDLRATWKAARDSATERLREVRGEYARLMQRLEGSRPPEPTMHPVARAS